MRILYVANGIRDSGALERVLLHVEVSCFHAWGAIAAYLRAYRKGLWGTVLQFQPDVVPVCDDGLKGLLVPMLLPRTPPALAYGRYTPLELMRSPRQKCRMRPLARMYDRLVLFIKGNGTSLHYPTGANY